MSSRPLSIEKIVNKPLSNENKWTEYLHRHIVFDAKIVLFIAIWAFLGQIVKLTYWLCVSSISSTDSWIPNYVLQCAMATSVAMLSQINESVRVNIFALVTVLLFLFLSFVMVLDGLNPYMLRYESINLTCIYVPLYSCYALFVSYALEVVDETDKGNVDTENLTQEAILEMCEEWRRYSKANTKKLGWLSLGSSVNLLLIFRYLYALFAAKKDQFYIYTLETIGFFMPNIFGLVVIAWVNDKFVFADSVTHKSSVKANSLGIAFSSASLPALVLSLTFSILKYIIFK